MSEVVEQTPAPRTPAMIKMGEHGIVISDLQEELNICKTLVEAKMVPASLDSPQKLFAARQLCRELGLPVVAAIRQVYVINGSPSLWGDTPLALVRQSKLLESIREYLIDKDYKEISIANKNLDTPHIAAVCTVKRKDSEPKEFFFTVEQAKKAGMGGGPVWAKYPTRMLQMKARGLALKNEFPDVLMGVAIAEYDYDEIPGVTKDVTNTNVNEVNNFFKKPTGESQQQGEDNVDRTTAN